MNEKVTLPAIPMNEQQQNETLQKMGLDFLSSIHWVIIIIIAVLFAGLMVFVKKYKDSEKAKQAEENERIIRDSAIELDDRYFTSDGEFNESVIPMPQRFKNNPMTAEEEKECTKFAEDGINQKINNAFSPNILQQLRRFAKSGGLFSFLNSSMNAKDRIQQELAGSIAKPIYTEDQKMAMNLRSRFGSDQLRNPLINSQIKNEINYRKQQRSEQSDEDDDDKEPIGTGNLSSDQMNILDQAFG